jgi:hypothetical protein
MNVVEILVVESIPEGKGTFASSVFYDCHRSEDEFFLPFDGDLKVSRGVPGETPRAANKTNEAREQTCPKQTNPSTHTRQKVVKSQEQQKNRNAAMNRLEEFFLGEPSSFASTEASPVSVLDVDRFIEGVDIIVGGGR